MRLFLKYYSDVNKFNLLISLILLMISQSLPVSIISFCSIGMVASFIITDHYYKDVLDIASKKLLMASGKIIPVNDEYDLAAAGYLSARQYGNP